MFEVIGNPELRNAKWSTGDGDPAEGNHAVFPLCTIDRSQRLTLVGTAFFVCTNGIFITARHVVMDGEQPIEPLTAIQFIENNQYLARPVINISVNDTDVALGSLAPATNNHTGQQLTNPILKLTNAIPQPGSIISTFAYPKSVVKDKESLREIHFQTTWRQSYASGSLLSNNDGYLSWGFRGSGYGYGCSGIWY